MKPAEGADVYIEETGAGDGDIKVTVDGEEYTAEANYDLDGDGLDETVAVMTDDGGHVAYIDDDADGRADLMQTISADGQVLDQARFHADTGEWTAETPQQHPGTGEHSGDDRQMVVDTPQGDVQVGPATEDTNSDGVADTAVVQSENGNTVMLTDVDGDGSADQVVEITTTGDVTISHHTGEGEWTVVEQGRIGDNGQYAPNQAASATDDATWTFDEPELQPRPAPADQGVPEICEGEPASSGKDDSWV
ncbi:DUF6802 family protein [Saccharopolyspora flava]|uniref:DUF6802 domain-containing protein n=1 Tax=Saccharopolyspora flava TaxID=95161 RepID=A0A1I6T9U2_9PSEU|nr:DUF6802 family protein [Saccharopolyspora flava]SFS85972.1 hypothetical protein SAMN05660874_03799 [Saccharopolyspora flava]